MTFSTKEPIALRGMWVAYSERSFGIDVSDLAVTQKNLQSGKTAYCNVGPANAPANGPSVSDLALKGNGSVAWIGESIFDNGKLVRAVVACDSKARMILDSGKGIDIQSLALHGSRLSWSHSGVECSALLE